MINKSISFDYENVSHVRDLTAQIELYNTMIGLERYYEAYELISGGMGEMVDIILYRYHAGRQLVKMLEMFFPNGLEHPPYTGPDDNEELGSFILLSLGKAYVECGYPAKAISLMRRAKRPAWDGDALRGCLETKPL